MNYTYGCVLTHEDDGWIAVFPQLGEYATDGDTREEALHMRTTSCAPCCAITRTGARSHQCRKSSPGPSP